jgi:hypothetical protein
MMRKLASPFLAWALLSGIFVGCTTSSAPSAPSVTPVGEPATNPSSEDTPLTETSAPAELPTIEASDLVNIDFTLGVPSSTLYSYVLTNNDNGYTNVRYSEYDGFLSARDGDNKSVLLTLDMKPVEYPKGDITVLEPFIFKEKPYFRVETKGTGWVVPPPRYEGAVQLGGYAILTTTVNSDDLEFSDSESGTAPYTATVDFGVYDYIDSFVDGKLRAYSIADKCYYIIDPDGTVLKTFPDVEKLAPYRLYPDGYYYTRSDVSGHSHAVVSWEGNEIIPYNTHKDDINAVYMGDGVFVSLVSDISSDSIYTAALTASAINYRVEFAAEQKPKILSDDEAVLSGAVPRPDKDAELLSESEGKIITYTVINGLVGPLAKREYTVTDSDGDVLIEPGRYTFTTGWKDGFCLAATSDGYVVLDADCKEVKIPDGIKLIGLYARDASLFIAEVITDFKLWRYADVPARYEHPIGILDGNLHWVVAPGELTEVVGTPIESAALFSGCVIDPAIDSGHKLLSISKIVPK